MKSLFWKNFIVYAGMLLIIFLLFGGAFVMQVDRYAASEKQRTLERTAQRAGETTELFLGNYSAFMEQVYLVNISQLAADNGAYLLICGEEGRIIYFFDEQGYQRTNARINDPDMLGAVRRLGKFAGISTVGGMFSESMFTVGVPLKDSKGDYLGAVFALSPAGETIKLLSDIIKVFLIGIWGSLMVGLTVAYFVTGRLVRPLRHVAMAAKRFAKGDFSVRVPLETGRDDEVAELAISFNNMAASLENLEEQRRGFVANVSHDLKTPMTTIAGFVDGILDGTIPPEKEHECLAIISEEVKRLSRLATRMLETSRFEMGGIVLNKTSFDICEMASQIILSFEQTLSQRKIDVTLHIPDKLVLTADRDTLFQAIYNLVDNAVKFIDDEGRLEMKIAQAGGFMEFTILNTGPEIPETDLPFLFDRFYKVDRSRSLNRQGSGLGLHIAKTTINLHGGDIWVKSRDGVTTFSFKIPING